MRKKLFEIIEADESNNVWSKIYDYFTMLVIVASLVPLAFKQSYRAFEILDYVCVGIFIADYFMRWLTADFKFGKRSVWSFVRYPFSFMALIDLISILPSLTILNPGFKLLRLLRMMRAFRVFRVFKAVRYSKSIRILADVLKSSRQPLASVGTFAIIYILVSALVVYNVEPESFATFFDAIYWATVSLTTVGYGDIYPVTVAGKVVTMVSSLCGIAIIALPSGIVTAGYMKAIGESATSTDNADALPKDALAAPEALPSTTATASADEQAPAPTTELTAERADDADSLTETPAAHASELAAQTEEHEPEPDSAAEQEQPRREPKQ